MFRGPVNPSYSLPPLGRRRTKHLDLPPRMQRKGQSFYYVCNGKPRKWLPLGSDLPRAKRMWAEYEAGAAIRSTVADIVQRYMDTLTDAAPSTLEQYASYLRTIEMAFPGVSAGALRAMHLAKWRDNNLRRKSYIKGCLGLLTAAWNKAREWGEIEADVSVSMPDTPARERYLTDAEFRAIRACAKPWLQVAMDVGYLTTCRPSDVCAMRWSDVSESLAVRQRKTKQRQAFTLSPELAAVLDTARRRPVLGLFVVATDKGRPISKKMLNNAWIAARTAAGILDAQFRDIRAKGATDAKSGGQDYQALLGHTTQAMSARYLRGKETVVAEPVRRKL